MIQLVSKRSGGCSELAILKRFSRPDIASHPDNHVLPLLEEFNYLDMVFVAVPLLNENVVSPWYYDIKEVLDAVSQTFKVRGAAPSQDNLIANRCSHTQGLAFMHEHLVAHLDIGCHDILHNYGGNAGRRQFTLACFKSSPFRSRLSGPCRYTFIDFELSAYFPYGFKPEQCKVIGMGLITAGRLTDADHYGKVSSKEGELFCIQLTQSLA